MQNTHHSSHVGVCALGNSLKLFCPSILDGSSIAYLGISCLIEKKCTLVISSLPRIDKVLYLNICTYLDLYMIWPLV